MMSLPASRYWWWIAPITSGRVNVSRSLLPRSSFECDAKRWPRKSASVSWWRWIMVPIAPSRTRIRSASSASSWCRTSGFIGAPLSLVVHACARGRRRAFGGGGNQDRERVAGLARADADSDVGQAGRGQHPLQLLVVEPEPPIAELGAHPFFLVGAQVEQQHVAAGRRDPRRLRDGAGRIVRVVQCLRQHRDVDRGVADRQLLELAFFPDHVRDATPLRQRPRALEHGGRAIDGDD